MKSVRNKIYLFSVEIGFKPGIIGTFIPFFDINL